MKILWKILSSFLVMIGLMVVVMATTAVLAFRHHMNPPLPDHMVLAYTLNGTPQDAPATPGWLAQLGGYEPTLAEVVAAITRATNDPRVSALTMQLGPGHYDWAAVQELRIALEGFKAADKKTYVYSESYGDLYPGMAEYYLASAFDEIWIQPMGSVGITGFAMEEPYVKNALAKLGIAMEVTHRGPYKTAPESLTLEHMSEAQRESLHSILSSMMTDFFDGVSKSRRMEARNVGQLIDGAPYTAEEAKQRGLIDQIGYQDQLLTKITPDSKDDELVNLGDYYNTAADDILKSVARTEEKELGRSKDIKGSKGKSVALIYITGMIVPGSDNGAGPFGDHAAMADDIAWDINDATNDKDVGAIVIRIDSPGGSPSASETIRRAVEVAKLRGKYVVVSMGSTAASGGYWVAVDANKIYALPGTLTGSIGVFGMKPDLSAMWGKLDINWDSVKLGANAGLASPNRPYDPEGQAAADRMMDDIYAGFIARVAKGRNFSEGVVIPLAGGRVWTGSQAKERGLVDELGGLNMAFNDVATHLGVTLKDLDVYVLPDAPNPLDEIMGFFTGGAHILAVLQPFLRDFALINNPEWGMAYSPNPLR